MAVFTDEDYKIISKYALEKADEAVAEQYSEVQSIRQRASFLVAVNAIAISAFVEITTPIKTDLVFWIAIISWTAAVFLCMRVMLPVNRWEILQSGNLIVSQFAEGEKRIPSGRAFAVMANLRDAAVKKNEKIVEQTHSIYFFATVFSAAHVVFWLAKIVFTPNIFGEI